MNKNKGSSHIRGSDTIFLSFPPLTKVSGLGRTLTY